MCSQSARARQSRSGSLGGLCAIQGLIANSCLHHQQDPLLERVAILGTKGLEFVLELTIKVVDLKYCHGAHRHVFTPCLLIMLIHLNKKINPICIIIFIYRNLALTGTECPMEKAGVETSRRPFLPILSWRR